MSQIYLQNHNSTFNTIPWYVWHLACKLRKIVYMKSYTHMQYVPKIMHIIMSVMASQITGILIVCSAVCLGTDQRKYQNSMSRAFVRGIHQWLVDSPHKGPVTQKMFPFDDVIMLYVLLWLGTNRLEAWNTFCVIYWTLLKIINLTLKNI